MKVWQLRVGLRTSNGSSPVVGVLFKLEQYPTGSYLAQLPRIDAWANMYWLERTDYPLIVEAEVMSPRLVNVLRDLGSTISTVPVRLHEHPAWKGRRITAPWGWPDAPSNGGTGRVESGWFVHDIPEVDCFDYEAAGVDLPLPAKPLDRLKVTRKLRTAAKGLREPSEGFPPVFEIMHGGASIFCTDSTKRELERAGMLGLEFTRGPRVNKR